MSCVHNFDKNLRPNEVVPQFTVGCPHVYLPLHKKSLLFEKCAIVFPSWEEKYNAKFNYPRVFENPSDMLCSHMTGH